MNGTVLERVNADLKEAMKRGDPVRLGTLRMLAAAIHNREIEKHGKGGLTPEDVDDVIQKEAKKRKESMQLFTQGGRNDLAEREAAELAVLKAYLPEELSEAEVRKVIAATVAAVQPHGAKDFGKVMGAAMRELKGRADSSLVTALVREALSE
jgi:uncharacterized protein